MQREDLKKQDEKIKQKLSKFKYKVAILSGKGGVGKSTISALLAIKLSESFKVGLLDADLHGPSVTKILGLSEKTTMPFGDEIIPVKYNDNLSVISIQFLLEQRDTPVIWRGPLKIGAIRQFIADVYWSDEEVLVVDLPPGTGDEPLTVLQSIPDVKVLIVTTPQKVAQEDVAKSIRFCRELKTQIIGVVENMSGFVCPHCGKETFIFKSGGGKELAEKYDVAFLGAIPLSMDIVSFCEGETKTLKLPESFEKFVSGLKSKL